MQRGLSTIAMMVLLVSGMSTACGQDGAPEKQTVAVYFGKYVPAVDLSESINAFLRGSPNADETVIVPQPVTNSLMVRGKAEVVQRVHEMLKQLDRKPASVFVEVVVVCVESDKRPARIAIGGDGGNSADELLDVLSKQGQLQVLARAQLMALDNQAAFVQIGRRKPHVTSVQESNRGVSRTVERENVGLTLGLTPRVTQDGTVLLETDLERSDLQDQEDGIEISPGGDQAVGVTTLSLQTTLCARSGQTVVIGGLTEGAEGKWQKLLAFLTATVLE
jgi:type II secretory pathway component GspD/PulD (secretin)